MSGPILSQKSPWSALELTIGDTSDRAVLMGIAHGERGRGGERWGRKDEMEGWAEEFGGGSRELVLERGCGCELLMGDGGRTAADGQVVPGSWWFDKGGHAPCVIRVGGHLAPPLGQQQGVDGEGRRPGCGGVVEIEVMVGREILRANKAV